MSDFGFRPDLAEFRRDPYPVYAELQSRGRVLYRPHYDDWLVTGYDEMKQCLLERFGEPSPAGACPVSGAVGVHAWLGRGGDWLRLYRWMDRNLLPNLSKAEHRRQRPLAATSLDAACGADLQREVMRLAGELLDEVRSDRMDLISAYAAPLFVRVLIRLMGLPNCSAAVIEPLGRAYIAGKDLTADARTRTEANLAFIKLASYLDGYLRSEAAGAAEGLIAGLMGHWHEGRIEYYELLAQVMLFALGGFENTQNALGLAIHRLLANPGATPPAGLDDAALKRALNECLRYDSPVQAHYYRAGEETSIGGQRIARGQRVHLIIAAANRDPARFEEAAAFVPDRDGPPHLAFGHGRHRCLGAGLAHMELFAAVRTLFDRFPAARLAAEPEFASRYNFRGLARLELQLNAGPVTGA